jgi:hypothetical protein
MEMAASYLLHRQFKGIKTMNINRNLGHGSVRTAPVLSDKINVLSAHGRTLGEKGRSPNH